MSGAFITCSCGHRADIDEFCTTPIFGALPKNVYQCPACHLAVERRMGPPTLLASGFVMPGKIEMVPVEVRM